MKVETDGFSLRLVENTSVGVETLALSFCLDRQQSESLFQQTTAHCAMCQSLVVYGYKEFSKTEDRCLWERERETALIPGNHLGGGILKKNK